MCLWIVCPGGVSPCFWVCVPVLCVQVVCACTHVFVCGAVHAGWVVCLVCANTYLLMCWWLGLS